MTSTKTPTRSFLVTLLAMAVSFSLAAPDAAHAANPGQEAQETGKDKAKDKKKTMTKTESGLQYRDLEEGVGKLPATGHTVVVDYTGWLWVNGVKGDKPFDSSKDRGVPFAFHVGNGEVIKGWDEGVAGMKMKGKRELVIPADLAYGERGAGGVIPPNATLMFEVKLLEAWEKTESGLEYFDTKIGEGAQPKTGQTCEMHYTGWLWQNGAKGKKFDSSVGKEPLPFRLGQGEVIKGWDEGVATMKVGGKRKLLIPAKLGYGDRGFPGAIPPKATLLFEIELLKVR